MRLHRLEIEAFGPFATAVAVDLDELADAGLFLLSGATGAGKTSVLDAVCFALYGDVPGDRSGAKRLRCDLAEPHVVPRVSLECTLAGRRFRFVRSPAWERPKKRGIGTTPQQALVSVLEHDPAAPGGWQPLTSRLDEAGDLVVRLLGLTLTQFTQVAMLPQGRFQAFLRARSEDRHRLLAQLFHTGRFEQAERWLRERRLELGRRHDRVLAEVAELVSRVSEAAGDSPPPVGWGETPEPLLPWSSGLLDGAGRAAADAGVAAGTNAEAERRARAALEEARRQAEDRRRRAAAQAELAQLEAAVDDHAARVGRLAAGRRAIAVLPVHAVLVEATSRAVAASDDLGLALSRAGGHRDAGALRRVAAKATQAAADVRAAQPRAGRLEQLGVRLTEATAARRELSRQGDRLRERRAALPARLQAARTAAEAAAGAALRVEAMSAEVGEVESQRSAALETEALGVRLLEAREALLGAREATVDATNALLAVQTARLDGMAAELAGALAVGACCPVCGSAEHPARARPTPGAPDADAEREARRVVDDAAAAEHVHHEQVRDLGLLHAGAEARAGGLSASALGERLLELRQRRDELEARASRQVELTAEVAEAEALLADLGEQLAAHQAELATHDERTAGRRQEADDLERELAALLTADDTAETDDADADLSLTERLAHALDRHLARRSRAEAALRAIDHARHADVAAADARAALAGAASRAGFADPHDAIGAALDRGVLDRLADEVARHERRLAAVREVLAAPFDGDLDPDAQAPDVGAPDVAALESTHEAALAARLAAEADAGAWSRRAARLADLNHDLGGAVAGWAPLRAELDLVAGLAAFVEGKAPDNRLRMRLSAYVLAYRLGQVVAAANERLATMSDQRYSLEHTGERGAGETRGGLSLVVRDDWSGESRDPATLSGGETFVVSLALALGLADVIAHEAGGAALDTLFVDEGFGSLDADTLDDVLDTLDALRDGGRVVGVVSHVAEMRDRIPTQLVVTKARTGSGLAVRR